MAGRKYRLLVVEDDETSLKVVKTYLKNNSDMERSFFNSPSEALEWAANNPFDIVLTDYKMPEMNGMELCSHLREINPDAFFLLMTAFAELNMAIEAIRSGIFDFLAKPFMQQELETALGRVVAHLELKNENVELRKLVGEEGQKRTLSGSSKEMNIVREKLLIFSQSDAPALITGETGVGKEIAARMLHSFSSHSDKPFVAINCSAFAETLLESELFGHEKGAFTGADKVRIGRLEMAGEGIVFLDEISEIPQTLQVKLLRVLQEREFERVGGNRPIKLAGRIISASNQTLTDEMAKGRFREDLFYRLNTLHIHIPPLRDRKEDIEEMANTFLIRFSATYGKEIRSFDESTMSLVKTFGWPGNVRQLENAIEYAVLCCNDTTIMTKHLPSEIGATEEKIEQSETAQTDDDSDILNRISAMEKRSILESLETNRWNKSQTARDLGMTRRQLIDRIKKYDIV